MNNNLSILGEEFQEAFQGVIEAESLDEEIKILKEKQKQLRKLSISKIKKVRSEKVKELHDLREKINRAISSVIKQRNSVVKAYCSKNGHNYVTTNVSPRNNLPFSNSFAIPSCSDYYGITIKEKCTVCGHELTTDTYKKFGSISFVNGVEVECVVPEECFEFKHPKTGKTYIELTNELQDLIIKEKYINQLLVEICKMFGHDVIDADPYNTHESGNYWEGHFECKCCGDGLISRDEYESLYDEVVYKGIVKYRGALDVKGLGEDFFETKFSDMTPIFDLTPKEVDIKDIESDLVFYDTDPKVLKKIRKVETKDIDFSKFIK